ncbi:MAG: hypothetical protein Q8Q09_00745 [Deltaproteobacteria bacterium]|nr:hypothetical protein [Deltaproteobacteria bacterium]
MTERTWPIAALRDAVEQACLATDLDLRYAASVQAYVTQHELLWPQCCNSQCDPCTKTFERAAHHALKLLAKLPDTPP